MASFLYFAELATDPTLDTVRELGLGYAICQPPMARECQGHTPSGNRGRVFGDSKRLGDRMPACDLKAQVWRKIPGKNVWVGYWKDAKPKPADLARKDMLPGYPIKMADGNEWQVPVVRSFDEASAKPVSVLPTLYGLDDSGQLTRGEIQEAHRWLWDLTDSAWDAMVTEASVKEQDMLPIAAKLIGANYAVDVVELAGVLQVFSPQLSPAGIVALAIDWNTWHQWATAKKKTKTHAPLAAGSSSSNGAADSHPATPPPALTSWR